MKKRPKAFEMVAGLLAIATLLLVCSVPISASQGSAATQSAPAIVSQAESPPVVAVDVIPNLTAVEFGRIENWRLCPLECSRRATHQISSVAICLEPRQLAPGVVRGQGKTG